MNLPAHLVRTDVRHFRWVLLLWCVCVAAHATATGLRPLFVADARLYGAIGGISGLLWIAVQASLLFIVPAIVQEHPAVGTDAFWMTRPIPRRTLWTSKVLLVAALAVIVPGAVLFALARTNHVSTREAALVAIDGGMERFLWVGLLMAAAVLTVSLARFALLLGSMFVALLLLMIVSIASFEAFGSAPPPAIDRLPPAPDPTAGVVLTIGLIVAAIVLVAVQYHTRRRRAAVMAGAACLVLAGIAAAFWPLPLLRAELAIPASARDAERMPLIVRSREIQFTDQMPWPNGDSPWRMARVALAVAGVPEGWQPKVALLGASLTLPGGARLESRRDDYAAAVGIGGWDGNSSELLARDILGVREVWTGEPPASETAVALVVPAGDVDRAAHTTAAYSGRFAVHLTHWVTAGALPLVRGASLQDGSHRLTIEALSSTASFVLIRGRESLAVSFDRDRPAIYDVYLRNRARSQALAGTLLPSGSGVGIPGIGIAVGESDGFWTRGVEIRFPRSGSADAADMPQFDRAWLADADLVVVRKTDTGAVMRTIEIPAVRIR